MEKKRPLKVALLDLAVLLYHLHLGAQKKEIGFEDCERTLRQVTDDLSPSSAVVDMRAIESALWSMNLLDEHKEFWSPHGDTFDQFIRRLTRYTPEGQKIEFDRFYNRLKAHAK